MKINQTVLNCGKTYCGNKNFEGIQFNFEDRMCLIYSHFPGCGKPLRLDWEAKSGHPGWFETSH